MTANSRNRALFLGAAGIFVALRMAAGAEPATSSPPETNSVAALDSAAAERASGANDDPELSQDDFKVRVVTNTPAGAEIVTNAAVTAALTNAAAQAELTNGAVKAEKNFKWSVEWRGWDGLYVSLSQTTHFEDAQDLLGLKTAREKLRLPSLTNELNLNLEQLQMTAKFGGLLEVDGAVYHTSKSLDISDNLAVRRLRVNAQGNCALIVPFSYKIELGYVPHKFILSQAWLQSDHIDYIGYLKGGVYQPPMGLDLITSSRDITFMEPGSVLQALAPPNEAGIQIGQPVFGQRATWTLGIFGGGLNYANEYGNASSDYGNVIGRLTYLPVDHITPEQPEENQYLHLGLSANIQYSGQNTVRFRSRPESYLAPDLIDTGNIDAGGMGEVGAEAAYVDGPFSAQAEFIESLVGEDGGDTLNFYGAYAYVSWFLTGESRPYDRRKGCFQRLIPLEDLGLGRGSGWGAVQIGARASYTDLTDDDIRGGRMALAMGELNWYLHSHVRWMFNLGGGNISAGSHDGNLLLFQSRVGVDF
jgi:phosphate-selective porin OprO/OprP